MTRRSLRGQLLLVGLMASLGAACDGRAFDGGNGQGGGIQTGEDDGGGGGGSGAGGGGSGGGGGGGGGSGGGSGGGTTPIGSALEILYESEDDRSPTDVQLSDSHAYVLFDDRVAGIAKTGGPLRKLASTASSARRLAVNSRHVYWVEYSGNSSGALCRAQIEGGAREPLVEGGDGFAVALSGQHVYWANYQDRPTADSRGSVWRANLDGSEAFELAGNQDYPSSIAIHQDHVYWLNSGFDADVMRAGLDGQNVESLARTGPVSLNLVVDTTTVYWSVTNQGDSAGPVLRAPLDGGEVSPVTVKEGGPPGWVHALASTDDSVYFADGYDFEGRVYRLEKSTGTTQVVARDKLLSGTWQLAIDATHVYFITSTGLDGFTDRGRLGRFGR